MVTWSLVITMLAHTNGSITHVWVLHNHQKASGIVLNVQHLCAGVGIGKTNYTEIEKFVSKSQLNSKFAN